MVGVSLSSVFISESKWDQMGSRLLNDMHFPHLAKQRVPKLGRGRGCLSQSSTESGSGMPLVSGSSRHNPQPTIGPLLYTTMAANEIAPLGLGGTREFTREPNRKPKLTSDMQRCLDYDYMVNRT